MRSLRILIFAFVAGLCLGACTPAIVCSDPSRAKTYDMLEWMLQTYPDHETTYLCTPDGKGAISDFSYHFKDQQKFYRIDWVWPGGSYFEEFEYNNDFIYIRKEVQDSAKGNYLDHTRNFIWTKRFVKVGPNCNDGTDTNSHYYYYEGCWKRREGGPDFTMMISGPTLFDVGGDVGKVEMLCLNQLNQSNKDYVEKYCYAKGWGMVYYEKIEKGVVTSSEYCNTKHLAAPVDLTLCGVTP